ncbi:MAG: dihydroorotase [Eubacteriales bacterium]|nr:dihydroorotase [Eubacteriales bacterium]
MDYLLKGVLDHTGGEVAPKDIVLSPQGLVLNPDQGLKRPFITIGRKDLHLFPGFTDVHVHLREPGFSYKETIATGTRAAARGGFGSVCAMPNVRPVPDSVEHLKIQLDIIEQSAVVRVIPFGAITRGQKGAALSDMAGMAGHVAGFSDDGRGVQDEGMMLKAMRMAKKLNKIIAAHCEDEKLTHGGYIHDSDYAGRHGHAGIPSESEWRQLARDLALAEKTGCKYHVCHVSTKESVALIRQAKARGVDVSCETAPHYLLFDDSQLQEEGRFRMNPPIRRREDREALLEGLVDGTIDLIATDHAPHSAQEKALGLKGSLNGVVGLETAFAALYTRLVKPGIISLGKLVDLMSRQPNLRFGIPLQEDCTLFDLEAGGMVDPTRFLSKGRSTPFEGMAVYGRCLYTASGGKTAWLDQAYFGQEGLV